MALLLAAGCAGNVVTAGSGGAEGGAGGPAITVPGQAAAGAASQTSGAGNAEPSAGNAGLSASGASSMSGGAGFENTEGGLLLIPSDGWIYAESNALGIRGSVFAYADSHSALSMLSNFAVTNACIQGTAAKVDLVSAPCTTYMFTPPALDCYGEFWGAAIGMNLNQQVAGATVDAPGPFDASALKGFGFELSGSNLPSPKYLRFQVESASGAMFCNLPTIKLKLGVNNVLFSDLVRECFQYAQDPDLRPTAQTEKSSLLKISWHVLTNTSAEVPYDFCISNIRALLE